jgi:hypothetical protein
MNRLASFLVKGFFALVEVAQMKRSLPALCILVAPFAAHGEIVEAPQANVTRVIGYDDYLNGAVVIFLDHNHSACPNGAYISPASPGAKTLIALVTSALLGSKPVVLQLYTDRVQSGRCEVDAVSVLAT